MFCPPRGAKKRYQLMNQYQCAEVSISYFKINPLTFCCPLFSENHLNPQVGINKIVNKNTLWTPKGFSRVFLEFTPKPVHSTKVAEKFRIYSVKITANTFVNQKIESVHFYSCPPSKTLSQVFIIIPQADRNCTFLPNTVF